MKSWIHDFSQLSPKRMLWPYERTANAFARSVIYYGLLLAVLKKSATPLVWALCVALLGTFLSTSSAHATSRVSQKVTVDYPVRECPKITTNNPMGNPMIGIDDITGNCPVNHDDPRVASRVHMAFHSNLPMSHWDIYGKNNSQRQFYTVPANDQTGFARWLYDPDQVMRCDKTIKAC